MKSIETQQKLLNDWFDGKYFLYCEDDEKRIFIEYLSTLFDLRFRESKECFKGAFLAWRFCKELHRHQLEIAEEENYWSGKRLEYKEIKEYVEMCIKSMSFITEVIKSSKSKE